MFGFKEDTGKRLRVIMAEKNINVSELADMSGVSPSTISSIRTGYVKKPKRQTAELIANALGVKISKIFPDV